MSKIINIEMNGIKLSVPAGTPICDLLAQAGHRGKFAPLGAVINNRIDGLYYNLKSPATVETIDISRREGMDIYRRTASTIMYAALSDIDPKAWAVVGQSIANGYFFEIRCRTVDSKLVSDIESKMKEIVSADISVEPEWTTVEDAIDRFNKKGDQSVVKLLWQHRQSEVPLITLKGYSGYAHGPFAYRTGLIDNFGVRQYEHGLVLDFPDESGSIQTDLRPETKLFATYLEAKKWNELIGTNNVADLNDACKGGAVADFVKVAEALHERKIAKIAEQIASMPDKKLVLIAGPSGSGKTTFSKRLAIHLKTHGIEPIALSIDDYYVDRDDTPKHPNGSYDFECMGALDVKLFNDQVVKLLHGEEVMSPHFSFPLGRRDPIKKKRIRLGKGQVLMTEGIHGLNDALTPNVPAQNKFKIYVSALTQVCLDDHNRIFTTDTRLCRRLVRDRLFRGTKAEETIARWHSVRAGEWRYIFPYQENADVIFNSALAYEHSLLKPYAERYLAEVPRDHPSFMEASRLVRFFSFFTPVLEMEVPGNSILREFIGKSAFKYG